MLLKKDNRINNSFLSIEYEEVEKLWFIRDTWNVNIKIIWDTEYSITPEWEFFLNSYKSICKKFEYFFQDFPFFWALILWLIWWIIWGLF